MIRKFAAHKSTHGKRKGPGLLFQISAFTPPSSSPYQCRCADGYRGDSLSLDLIDEWSLTVRGLDGAALPENPALRTEELA